MTKKRPDKKTSKLEPDFRDILVCKKKELRPNIEIFIQAPENVSQQNLGTLAGIFEITDESEDSSYIVNYLISIIKKEYFSKVKRGSMESFEAALHKANLALSKLAEHETVGWINNINAICIAIEKNNLHISQTGTAGAYLLRSKSLTDICDSQNNPGNQSPLKTFEDVISGRLDQNDKIILTTNSIFDIFSLDEIKKSALKFNSDEFVQFLNTALVNELERAAVLIIDMEENIQEETIPNYAAKRKARINAFSQQAFIPKDAQVGYMGQEERQEIVEEIKKELVKSQEGFIDKKTGHIYIRDDGKKQASGQPSRYFEAFKTAAADFGEKSSSVFKKNYHKIKKAASNAIKTSGTPPVQKPTPKPVQQAMPQPIQPITSQPDIRQPISQPEKLAPPQEEKYAWVTQHKPGKDIEESKPIIVEIKERIYPLAKKSLAVISKTFFYSKIFFWNRIYKPALSLISIAEKNLDILWNLIFSKSSSNKKTETIQENPPLADKTSSDNNYHKNPEALAATRTEKLEWFRALSKSPGGNLTPVKNDIPTAGKLMPDFSKLRAIFSRLDYSKRLYIVTAILLLFIVPYFIARALGTPQNPKTPDESVVPAALSKPLENDKNVTIITSVENVMSGTFGKLANANGKIFAAKASLVISLEDKEEYDIAQEFQNPDLFFAMDDLNLIFLYKDGKIVSISATSRKYQDNNLSVPSGARIVSGASYLTYGYLLDVKNNQIYRYPRAEGGFGEKTDWLKDQVDFSGARDMAINENVYVTDGKNILKFYRGKKQDFTVSQTATPISIDQIYTKPDYQSLYILDKTNSRIIKLDANGQIVAQYYNAEIGKTSDFAVDESTQKIYITSENGVGSFGMN